MRYIGHEKQEKLDPYLLVDAFSGKYPKSFIDHPSCGFKTITYVTEGELMHENFKGHKGRLEPGDVQLLNSGKGMLNAMMPASSEIETKGI